LPSRAQGHNAARRRQNPRLAEARGGSVGIGLGLRLGRAQRIRLPLLYGDLPFLLLGVRQRGLRRRHGAPDRLEPGLRRRHGAPCRLDRGLRRLFVGPGGVEIGSDGYQVLWRVDVPFHQRPDAVEVVLGLGDRRLGLHHLRLRLTQLGFGLRHLRLRLLRLGLGLRHLRLCLANLGGQGILQQLSLGHRLPRAGPGLCDGVAGGALVGAQLVLIEHGDQVAGLDPLPVVHRQAHDAASDLAAHYHLVAIHGAGQHERLRTRTLHPPDGHGDGHNQQRKTRSFHAEDLIR
jgi:hypothetical protein